MICGAQLRKPIWRPTTVLGQNTNIRIRAHNFASDAQAPLTLPILSTSVTQFSYSLFSPPISRNSMPRRSLPTYTPHSSTAPSARNHPPCGSAPPACKRYPSYVILIRYRVIENLQVFTPTRVANPGIRNTRFLEVLYLLMQS